STDNSEQKVLNLNDDRIRYFNQPNKGVSNARNFGIANASSPYIAFLDADDFWETGFLLEMHRLIRKFPDQEVFAAAIEIETAGKTISAKYSVDLSAGDQVVDYFEASLLETVICTSCSAFSGDVFKVAGCFDERLKSGEDTDLWI